MNFIVIWIVFVMLVGVGVLVMSRIKMRNLKSAGDEYLRKYPDAAKVYLFSKISIVSETIMVYSVDGEPPHYFYETGKTGGIGGIFAGFGMGSQSGFYVKPGICTVELSYSHNRPGVLYRNVTTTTDVVQKKLSIEANKSYILGFDRKAESFTFEETS